MGRVIGKISNNLSLGIFVSGLIIWHAKNTILFKIYNHNLHLLAYILSFAFPLIHATLINPTVSKTKLSKDSKSIIAAEMLSILLVAICTLALKKFNWI